MNYEIIFEKIDAEYGTAIRILKFAADKFHVVSRDEDAGQTIGVTICKTLDLANAVVSRELNGPITAPMI